MQNIKQFLMDRGCNGPVRLTIVSDGSRDIVGIVNSLFFSVYTHTPDLVILDRSEAVTVLELLIWKELAYDTEMMPRSVARGYAEEYVNTYYEDGCVIYSNARLNRSGEASDLVFYFSMTSSVFDGGLIIVHKDYAACLWIEDND